jgi:hypothetical protein
VEGADSDDLAIPDEDKKISEMVIEFAKRPGEDPSSRSVDLKQPLNLFDVIEFSLSNHLILLLLSSRRGQATFYKFSLGTFISQKVACPLFPFTGT